MVEQRLSSVCTRGLALLAAGAMLYLPMAWAAPPDEVVTRQAIVRQLTAPREEHKGLVKVEDPAPAIDFRNITFALGSSELTPTARAQLDELAAALASDKLQGLHFQVVGHTDARGERAFNQALSERRAIAVRDYLVRTGGLDPHRLEAVGRGMDTPSHAHDPLAAENRRVEIRNMGENQ